MTDEFKVLTDREHILSRPSMYLGSITNEEKEDFILGNWKKFSRPPGLIKSINEVLDNSIDEAIRTDFKYANKIKVTVSENEVIIEDNGRGIPLDDITLLDGSVVPRPYAAWTQAKAGSNFSDDRTTIGMNGLGSALTNFYSRQFIGKTCDGKRTFEIKCINNGNVAEHGITNKADKQGTIVSFIPDFDRFEGIDENTPDIIEAIEDRVTALQIAYPEIAFYFNGTRIKETDIRKYAQLYSDTVVDYRTHDISFFAATSSDGFRQRSYVNGVETANGGRHIDFIIDQFSDHLIPMIKKKYKVNVSRSLIQQNLTLVVFIRGFNNPKFDSQTKERLTNTAAEVREFFSGVPFDKISKKILDTDEIVNPIVDALVAKQLAKERREATLKAKELKRKKVDGHIKAYGEPGTGKKILYLAEGLSAIGSLLDARDPQWVGGLPLRGVVMNVFDMKPVDVMKNKELANIMAVLGISIGEEASNMDYDKIAIMCDADLDGGKIAVLLVNFFYKFWPELFEQERVGIMRTPVMISSKGTASKWFYTSDDASKFKASASGWNHRYIKGLASLTPEEFKKALSEPVLDIIDVDEPELFKLVFSGDAESRKEWIMGGL